MNARQKCKKLKKELQRLKDKPILGYVVQTQIPIDKYVAAFRINYNDTRFPTSVEQQEELVKRYCAKQTAEFIEKYFHITREREDENGKTYYIEFWLGQEDRMREPTIEERESVKNYIDSISRPTGIAFDETVEKLSQVPEVHAVSLEDLKKTLDIE